jgi:hypothetical protein
MGRIIKVSPGQLVPSGNTNIALRMTKLVKPREKAECPECVVAVDGLFWQDAATGEFDISSDITEYGEEVGGPA